VKILGDIYTAGYKDSMVIQDFIPGDDTYMRVLTCYSDMQGKVQRMALGHVLLEEHTPHGLGNHAVIINDYDETLMSSVKTFLEKIQFKGFSNFDIKYDTRDGVYKIFEINVRQGRSNFYVTGAGDNIAQVVVEDAVYGRPLAFKNTTEKHLWLVVPFLVAIIYVRSKNLRFEMIGLVLKGKMVNPLWYTGDYSWKRSMYLWKSHFSHFFKYFKYYR
jgi:D-aspartate ligase